MNREEYFEYIKNRYCNCSLCYSLRERVLENGIEEIKEYEFFECPEIVDWKFKYPKKEI